MNIRIIFFYLGLCLFPQILKAQDALPVLKIETLNAENLISWNNQYNGVKSIIIQRSADSVFNYTAIGFMAKPAVGFATYKDESPLSGKNFYRLLLVFQSDLEWYSNTYKVVMDSSVIAASRLGKINRVSNTNNNNYSNTGNATTYTDFYYEPSTQVYTNPYTGHITISLPDAKEKRYAIKFFNPQKEEVLAVSRITNTNIVLDKYNFNARGTYSFQLLEAGVVVETGYVTLY